MTDKLLPCPFCGSTDTDAQLIGNNVWIECNKCKATGPERGSMLSAIRSWDTRPTPPAGSARVQGLVDALEHAAAHFGKTSYQNLRNEMLDALAAYRAPAGGTADKGVKEPHGNPAAIQWVERATEKLDNDEPWGATRALIHAVAALAAQERKP